MFEALARLSSGPAAGVVVRKQAVHVRYRSVERRLAGVPKRRFEETAVEPAREIAEDRPLSCGFCSVRLHAVAHRRTQIVRLDQSGDLAPRAVVRRYNSSPRSPGQLDLLIDTYQIYDYTL